MRVPAAPCNMRASGGLPGTSIILQTRKWERYMKETYQKKIDLGRCGAVTLHVGKGGKRLLLEFETEPEGLDKTGLNSFIEALKKVRERMER